MTIIPALRGSSRRRVDSRPAGITQGDPDSKKERKKESQLS
jgi:hypothetical protein